MKKQVSDPKALPQKQAHRQSTMEQHKVQNYINFKPPVVATINLKSSTIMKVASLHDQQEILEKPMTKAQLKEANFDSIVSDNSSPSLNQHQAL
jgi:hypothetical protein